MSAAPRLCDAPGLSRMFRRAGATAVTALTRTAHPPHARRQLCNAPTLRLDPTLEAVVSRFRASTSRGTDDKSLVDKYQKLQAVRVKKVLLVCTDYDSYTFEEENVLTDVVYQAPEGRREGRSEAVG